MGLKSSFLDIIFLLEYGIVRLFHRKINMEAMSIFCAPYKQDSQDKGYWRELLHSARTITGQRLEGTSWSELSGCLGGGL